MMMMMMMGRTACQKPPPSPDQLCDPQTEGHETGHQSGCVYVTSAKFVCARGAEANS